MSAARRRRAWSLLYEFVQAQDRHAELAEALGFGLGGGRGRVLVRLRTGPMTLGEIAAAQGTDAPYATLIVDRLEGLGLVERRPHPDDRRRKLVSLTPAGRRALDTADAILLRPPPELSALSAAELDQLTTLLGRLVAPSSG